MKSIPTDTIGFRQLINYFYKFNICIRCFVILLSTNFTQHKRLTMGLSVLCNIPMSFWPKHHTSLLLTIADLTQLFYKTPFTFSGNLFPQRNLRKSVNFTHLSFILACNCRFKSSSCIYYLPRYRNLSMFLHRHAVFPPDHLRFCHTLCICCI